MSNNLQLVASIAENLELVEAVRKAAEASYKSNREKAHSTVKMIKDTVLSFTPQVLSIMEWPWPDEAFGGDSSERYVTARALVKVEIRIEHGPVIAEWQIDATGMNDPAVITQEEVLTAISVGLQKLIDSMGKDVVIISLPEGIRRNKKAHVGDLLAVDFEPGIDAGYFVVVAETWIVDKLDEACEKDTSGVFHKVSGGSNYETSTGTLEFTINPLADAVKVRELIVLYIEALIRQREESLTQE